MRIDGLSASFSREFQKALPPIDERSRKFAGQAFRAAFHAGPAIDEGCGVDIGAEQAVPHGQDAAVIAAA